MCDIIYRDFLFFGERANFVKKFSIICLYTRLVGIVHRKQISYICNAYYKYCRIKMYAAERTSNMFWASNEIWIQFLVCIRNQYNIQFSNYLGLWLQSLNYISFIWYQLYQVIRNNNDDAADNIPQTTNDIFLMYTWLYKYIKY